MKDFHTERYEKIFKYPNLTFEEKVDRCGNYAMEVVKRNIALRELMRFSMDTGILPIWKTK